MHLLAKHLAALDEEKIARVSFSYFHFYSYFMHISNDATMPEK